VIAHLAGLVGATVMAIAATALVGRSCGRLAALGIARGDASRVPRYGRARRRTFPPPPVSPILGA
jgi:hypothetical protein